MKPETMTGFFAVRLRESGMKAAGMQRLIIIVSVCRGGMQRDGILLSADLCWPEDNSRCAAEQ